MGKEVLNLDTGVFLNNKDNVIEKVNAKVIKDVVVEHLFNAGHAKFGDFDHKSAKLESVPDAVFI